MIFVRILHTYVMYMYICDWYIYGVNGATNIFEGILERKSGIEQCLKCTMYNLKKM
jgi:hypothetical protein